jgi:endonuclease YncB( thermonuclease family)
MTFSKIFCCCGSDNNLTKIKNSDIKYFSLHGYKTKAKMVNIYDGDTCTLAFNYKGNIVKFKCRLNGIDCPEMAPSLEQKTRGEEIKNAIQARNTVIKIATNIHYINDKIGKKQLETLLDKNDKLIDVTCFGFDKYGRLLVELVSDNININKYLMYHNLAKAYDGGTKIS